MDVTNILPDTTATVPTIAWLPYHFEDVPYFDAYTLKSVTAVTSSSLTSSVCWLLAASCWLLAAGCCLLSAVCWLLAAG
jgi:hypothetical protein